MPNGPISSAFATLQAELHKARETLQEFVDGTSQELHIHVDARGQLEADLRSALLRLGTSDRELERARQEAKEEREVCSELRSELARAQDEARELRKVSRIIAYENENSRLQFENARMARELERRRSSTTLDKPVATHARPETADVCAQTSTRPETADGCAQTLIHENVDLREENAALRDEVSVLTAALQKARRK